MPLLKNIGKKVAGFVPKRIRGRYARKRKATRLKELPALIERERKRLIDKFGDDRQLRAISREPNTIVAETALLGKISRWEKKRDIKERRERIVEIFKDLVNYRLLLERELAAENVRAYGEWESELREEPVPKGIAKFLSGLFEGVLSEGIVLGLTPAGSADSRAWKRGQIRMGQEFYDFWRETPGLPDITTAFRIYLADVNYEKIMELKRIFRGLGIDRFSAP